MKLWEKKYELNKEIEKFTVGNDYLIDLNLIEYDCIGTIAHIKMLNKIGILTNNELNKIIKEIENIRTLNKNKKFKIKLEDEDCHTAIEKYLIKKLGDIGKKIHTGRSRNDQVLTALRLYEKNELIEIKKIIIKLKHTLLIFNEKYGKINIPGYTHMQKAMPTTIGTWILCFENSMEDNLKLLESTLEIIDQSPLGSAAGFGIKAFNLDKEYCAKLLGFKKVQNNPIYAQMSRGKFESNIINVLTQIMFDLNKLTTDIIVYSMVEFNFLNLPIEFCTGSSIMPQKKNPDVLELVRAKYHIILGEEFKIKSLMANLISGYNRDVQLTKTPTINSLNITKSSINIMNLVIKGLKININACNDAMTEELFATAEAYKLVKQGIPFREAYKIIGNKYLNKK